MRPSERRSLSNDIENLVAKLKDLADGDDLAELIRLIGDPGWTTSAEFVFARGLVTSLLAKTAALAGMKKVLLKGSRAVGTR